MLLAIITFLFLLLTTSSATPLTSPSGTLFRVPANLTTRDPPVGDLCGHDPIVSDPSQCYFVSKSFGVDGYLSSPTRIQHELFIFRNDCELIGWIPALIEDVDQVYGLDSELPWVVVVKMFNHNVDGNFDVWPAIWYSNGYYDHRKCWPDTTFPDNPAYQKACKILFHCP